MKPLPTKKAGATKPITTATSTAKKKPKTTKKKKP
jgi:hypothetical protein